MRRLGTVFAFTLLLFAYDVFAEEVYISGNDGVALQAAIDAANTPGSQVTIHLEAGQVFDVIPSFSKVTGNITIEGNGASWRGGPSLNSSAAWILPEGALTITGVTIVNPLRLWASCSHIHNRGSLTLERVTLLGFHLSRTGKYSGCFGGPRQLLHNEGSAKLVNVTIAGTTFDQPGGNSVIHTSENASTEISHLTVADNYTDYPWEGDWHNSILLTDPGGSTSINNSIILANSNLEIHLVPCDGPITDSGGNFASSGECGSTWGLIDRASLSQIVEKGHDAWVVPLVADSIAADAGDPDNCERLDGRGFERGALCDSGAYELSASNHGGELGRGGISGFYYTPESDGNYIQVQRAYDGNVVVIWNTFDTSGAQAWVNAVGSYQDGVIIAKAYRNLGGIFQPGGGASGGTETDWGTLRVTAHDCNHITVEYSSTDPNFASGTFEATRLAYVHDLGCSDE